MNAENGKAKLHVAIIMDGNGRWARGRGQPRVAGHREGAKAVRGFGDVVLNVNARKLTVERNDRFEDYTTTAYEV